MKRHFFYELFTEMTKNQKNYFFESLGGFNSVSLLGTEKIIGQTNLTIVSSFFHNRAHPPLIELIFRHSPPKRDTLRNILETEFYTINLINEFVHKESHHTSVRYDNGISEFDVTGLQPEYKNNFLAFYGKESNIQIGVESKEKTAFTINNTILINGQIKQIYIPEDCFCEDGFIVIEKTYTLTYSGMDSFHKKIKVQRLSYAKLNKKTTSLS